MSCVIVMVFIMIGAALYMFTVSEVRAAERERDASRALALAEAGLERAICDLRLDLVNDPDFGSWTDGAINGIPCVVTADSYTMLPYTGNSLGPGTYAVELKSEAGRTGEIWIRVTGNASARRAAIQSYVRAHDLSVWKNAIYAGAGGGGVLITGQMKIAGSVHILGDNLASTDVALNLGGSAAVINTHTGMPVELDNAVAPLPKVLVDGKLVESLGSEFRVRNGTVVMDGGGLIGEADNPFNTLKESMDGVYTNDGIIINSATASVNSDNGMDTSYDFGDIARFPSLYDSYEGYPTYLEYVKSQAFVINQFSMLTALKNIKPTSSFTYTDPAGKGSISVSGGEMTINGIVYIEGDLGMGSPGTSDTITYKGRGTIVVTGDVKLNSNLYPAAADSFPSTNIIGIMTPGQITFDGAWTKVAGLFYAENKITSKGQTSVAGAFVSSFFDMGTQVPSIYQVPLRKNDIPAGLIGAAPSYAMTTVFWEKLPVSQCPTYTAADLP
ncbi:MAG TPA: hypothetical protein DCM87_20365 [Planctomycetes bacterium]|nr:hypothetical protein [Planctomycetota bacterium]